MISRMRKHEDVRTDTTAIDIIEGRGSLTLAPINTKGCFNGNRGKGLDPPLASNSHQANIILAASGKSNYQAF